MDAPPFHAYLGLEVLRREDGEAEVRLELKPRHLNRRGVAHGGVVTAMLDTALGAAVVSSIPAQWWCATISLTTQFLAGAGAGRLIASGRVLRRGRTTAFAGGDVRDATGRLVASATGAWHLWPYRPGKGEIAAPGGCVVLRGSGEPIRVGKILAVGRNYADHVLEMGAPESAPPVLFLKPPGALVAGGGRVAIPTDAGKVHYEVELVAVVGRRGRRIPPERALEHVLGFAVGLDLTLRDVQAEAKLRGEPWSVAKGFDGSAPVSAVAPREDVGDGSGLAIGLRVNGKSRQRGNTSRMLHSVADLVALASRWMTLERGDLVFTGTPAGVGPVRPGDRLEAEVERVGSLVVEIAAEEPPGPPAPPAGSDFRT